MKTKFEIFQGKDGMYYFRLVTDSGQIILTGDKYPSVQETINAIQSVKSSSRTKELFEKRKASNGKYYFVIKSGDGEVLGKSNLYSSKTGQSTGMYSVRSSANNAIVEEPNMVD